MKQGCFFNSYNKDHGLYLNLGFSGITKPIRSHFFVEIKNNCLALCRPMNYISDMDFEWDPEKSNRCYIERGFDFAYAALGFFDPDRIVIKDNRYDYGEPRYQMISKIQGRAFVVIFTPRSNAIRIISARKANQREIKQYEKTSHDD